MGISTQLTRGFHGSHDATLIKLLAADPSRAVFDLVRWQDVTIDITERSLSYRFDAHFHPYVSELVSRLIEKSVAGLQAIDTETTKAGGKEVPLLSGELFTATDHVASPMVAKPYPTKELDFSARGGYSVYNWELFFHVPLTLAIHLSRNARYAEAQRWFHYVFDPTDSSDGPTPDRYWKVKPFQTTDVKMIEDVLVNLSSGQDKKLQEDTVNAIGAWKGEPFRPHLVARYRPSAYMFKTVMAYLDNLIDWGDSLFRQDTGEAVNEATQLYVLAANILGPKPQAVPRKGTLRAETYASIRKNRDALGNVLRDVEADLPFDDMPAPPGATDANQVSGLRSIGRALYFCVPRNDKLLAYWDTVADRLFKIRNSLNIQGIFRQLPLFDPPIDPAMLARAAAAGLDVSAIAAGVNQPLPLVRFAVLVQKAAEICQEVKSLGANLLAAAEKEDNEALAVLRARHEAAVTALAEAVRYSQLQEAIKNREGLEQSLALAKHRFSYYERMLGRKADEIKFPDLEPLDTESLGKFKFKAGEPDMPLPDVAVDIAQDLNASGGKIMSSHEAQELSKLADAHLARMIAQGAKLLAGALEPIPEFDVNLHFWGLGGTITLGGSKFARVSSYAGDVANVIADHLTYEAGLAGRIGGFARREQDWALQRNLAAGEINQLFKQIRAAQIREAVAAREWENHKTAIKNAEEIQHFLAGEATPIAGQKHKKFGTQALYTWMKREVRGLYGQCLQLAFEVAKKAERALQHELGDPSAAFLQPTYLGGKEGLLAGERLYYDVKRMETAYLDLNRREYELTKHVSLLQLNPLALLQLRATGRCTLVVPEEAYDFDGPGHYFRRIKSVAVSVPCVVGPYASVNCTLTLLKSSVRKSPLLRDDVYAREGPDDDRFSDHFGSTQSVVTSSGQSDSGMFEPNLRDDRYLPFEGAGAVSEWQLELPSAVRQFDYDTIADVILHVRYTAREAGGKLKLAASKNLEARINEGGASGSVRFLSVRHEFPTAWAAFKRPVTAGTRAKLELGLLPAHYPFWSTGRLGAVKRAEAFVRAAGANLTVTTKAAGATVDEKDDLGRDPTLNLVTGVLKNTGPKTPTTPDPTKPYTLYFDTNALDDLWLLITWGQ